MRFLGIVLTYYYAIIFMNLKSRSLGSNFKKGGFDILRQKFRFRKLVLSRTKLAFESENFQQIYSQAGLKRGE